MPYAVNYLAYGTAVTKKNNLIAVELSNGSVYSPLLINTQSSETNVYYCNISEDEFRLGGAADIFDAATAGASNANRILVFVDCGDIKDVIIFD
jgi:hypothetical protein